MSAKNINQIHFDCLDPVIQNCKAKEDKKLIESKHDC